MNKYFFMFAFLDIVEPVSQVYRIKSSSVQLNCSHRATSSKALNWNYSPVYPFTTLTPYTINEELNTEAPAYPRFNVIGDSSSGEYNLVINNLKKEDEGYYICNVESTNKETVQELVIVVGPSSVALQKTDNKLLGTEGQSLQITCTAVGGNPAPDVQILKLGSLIKSNKQIVTYITQTLQRSDDGQKVTCRAGYKQMNSFPLNDSALFYLKLKPLIPNYSRESVSVIDGNKLDITCTSNGCRPAAVFNWYIDDANITDSSVIISSMSDGSTFTVTSRLTFILTKDNNGKYLRCKAINIAAPNGVEPALPIIVDVKYSPTVTVEDKVFTEEKSPAVLICKANGNPNIYNFYEWTHESLLGKFIRNLNSTNDGRLILPDLNKSLRYQNTGRYTCTVGNGIPDTATKKSGSGVLTIEARPVFAMYNSWTQRGEIRKAVNISVYVYSIPEPNFVWYQGGTMLPSTGYKTSFSQTTVTVRVYGKEVDVTGYIAILTITEAKETDFNTTYKLRVQNSIGHSEQSVLLESSSAPDPPQNFSVIDQTDHSITVQWVAGYDGGHEQTFYVVYRQHGTDKWTTKTVPMSTKAKPNQLLQSEISGLQHSTTYEIKMFAENQQNKSAETLTKTGLTDTKADGGSNTGAVIGGVAGSLSAVFIILIVVMVIMKFRNRSGTGKDGSTILSDGSESEAEGLKENVLYESSGPDIEKSSGPVYTEVTKNQKSAPNKSNDVYSEVKKTPQKKDKALKTKTKAKNKNIDKNKKTVFNNNQDSEYANSDLPLKRYPNEEYVNAEDVQGKTGRYKNADGLEYADLSFAKPSKTAKPVIHGEERNIYSDIDHTKVAPPPPQEGAYEETTICKAKTK